MNKRVKAKWITALRSGEYKQGHNALRDGDTFCCLGVLCDLFRGENHRGKWVGMTTFVIGDESSSSSLPTPVQEWAGVNFSNPRLGKRFNSPTAITLNDSKHKDFNYIADRIEKYL